MRNDVPNTIVDEHNLAALESALNPCPLTVEFPANNNVTTHCENDVQQPDAKVSYKLSLSAEQR